MLHEALRLLRVFHDMKRNELATKLKVSNSYVSEIENGNKTPSLEILNKYSEFFNVPVSSIMFFSEELGRDQTEHSTSSKLKNGISSTIINFLKIVENNTELNSV